MLPPRLQQPNRMVPVK